MMPLGTSGFCLSSQRLRMGMITNFASRPAAIPITAPVQSTATQLPVDAFSTLASGTSNDAVPLAVYMNPLFAPANLEP